jgi:hypothetical protein
VGLFGHNKDGADPVDVDGRGVADGNVRAHQACCCRGGLRGRLVTMGLEVRWRKVLDEWTLPTLGPLSQLRVTSCLETPIQGIYRHILSLFLIKLSAADEKEPSLAGS